MTLSNKFSVSTADLTICLPTTVLEDGGGWAVGHRSLGASRYSSFINGDLQSPGPALTLTPVETTPRLLTDKMKEPENYVLHSSPQEILNSSAAQCQEWK